MKLSDLDTQVIPLFNMLLDVLDETLMDDRTTLQDILATEEYMEDELNKRVLLHASMLIRANENNKGL